MAIWNYRYYLIPSAAIRNKFNANKDIILDEYRSNGFQNFNENKSFENYFINNDFILLSIINEAKKSLNRKSLGIKMQSCFVIILVIVLPFGQMI